MGSSKKNCRNYSGLTIPIISNCNIIVKNGIFSDYESFSKITAGPKRNPKCGTKPDGDPDSYITTDISSDKNSDTKILIEYENDETLDTKEEIIQVSDHKTNEDAGQKRNKKCVSKLCTVDIRKHDILAARNKLWSQKKQKIQESLEKEYKCEKCARTYKQKRNLTYHQTFECGVMPQFSCKFCKKKFRQKSNMSRHIDRVHHKTNSETSKIRHYCDKCTRSYTLIEHLYRHKRLEHAAVKPQFICDICGHISKEKAALSRHITSRHFK